ncbi:SurA N-terminal domain-containing protein [Fontisphaera persica]|uniref:peptidylprolyl isomerase n=1 Tax=Fontisphaera persica TaxID=2974023 RepID=UPI0024C0A144|nr:SurA N-terminal domain-containing protein [Fontisphaera persica]WCJ59292.1 SurA N-terminal domain-containing protein [Fontisphaera persica]
MTKRIQWLGVLAWLCCWTAATVEGQGLRRDGILAIVHNAVITAGDVDYLTEPVMAALRVMYRDRDELRQRQEKAFQDGLETLIERKLILHEFKTSGLMLPETVIDEEIRDRIRRRFGDRVQLIQTLKAQGRTFESWRQEVREQIIEEAMRAKNVSRAILISPHKIESYYSTNQAQYAHDDQVKLLMIRLDARAEGVDSAKKRGQEILQKLKNGQPFREMLIYNEGAQSDWGWVDRKSLRRGITDQFFHLKPGQYSPLVGRSLETEEEGYWIYVYADDGKLTLARRYLVPKDGQEKLAAEHQPGDPALNQAPPPREFYLLFVEEVRSRSVRPLPEVRDEIEKLLVVQERDRLQKKWINRLRAKTFVQIF